MLSQAAIDMTRLTFTSDAVAEGAEDEVGKAVFDTPFTSLFLEEDVSHLGTERMYSSEVQRALRDALYMSSDAAFTAAGLPSTKEDQLLFGAAERPPRFNASDFARNPSQNVTMVDDRFGSRARRCSIYPALAQANWRLGDIDEGDAALDRCLAECTGDVSLDTASAELAAPNSEDIEKYTARILASGAQCQEIRNKYEPSK